MRFCSNKAKKTSSALFREGSGDGRGAQADYNSIVPHSPSCQSHTSWKRTLYHFHFLTSHSLCNLLIAGFCSSNQLKWLLKLTQSVLASPWTLFRLMFFDLSAVCERGRRFLQVFWNAHVLSLSTLSLPDVFVPIPFYPSTYTSFLPWAVSIGQTGGSIETGTW